MADNTQQKGVETPNTEQAKEAKNNLSDTAEFVHQIAKNYIYPELRTDTDELDRTS